MAKNMQADFVQSRQACFVRCCLNYKNCDVLSGYGEQNLIKVESDNLGANKISDWYIPYDEYDVYIRGELTSLPQESIWESEKSQEILRKQKKENTILKNHYAQITNNQELDFSYDIAENSSEQPLAASASLNSLNKHNIVVWATNNCNKTNPTSGNSSQVSSYYDFSTIANNYDCSNFVKYLNLTASNVTLMGIPYSSDASFTFESMTSDGNFATLTGSYISPSGGYGKFTFIVENVKGRFFVNDMYYDSAPDMVDKLVRPEFINSPTPNYWQSDENLAAERILTAVQ